jgi:hypothetical protein
MLALADEIRGIRRREDARIQARYETVRQLPKSKRRTEMLELYRELLEPAKAEADKRRRDIAEIYEQECRSRTQHITRNGARNGWFLWDPTKNKTISTTCNETPTSVCALLSKRARDLPEAKHDPHDRVTNPTM